jgi:hypothetical protein
MNTISLSIEKGKNISGHYVGETYRESEENRGKESNIKKSFNYMKKKIIN